MSREEILKNQDRKGGEPLSDLRWPGDHPAPAPRVARRGFASGHGRGPCQQPAYLEEFDQTLLKLSYIKNTAHAHTLEGTTETHIR